MCVPFWTWKLNKIAPGKVFCIMNVYSVNVDLHCSSSGPTPTHLKCLCSQSSDLGLLPIFLPCLISSSSDLVLEIPPFFLWARCLLDSRCIVPCGHLTGISNLCTPRTELGSFLLNLPSPQASQLGKWACTTPCPIVLFVCFFPSCCFSSNHLSSLPSHARIVFFLDCSKSLLTLLTKSSLPPVKLYPAVRKVLKHKSDHVTICFKVWNDYPLLKINIFQ